MPGAAEAVDKKPENEAKEMGPGYGGNPVPNERAGAVQSHLHIRHPLRVQMNLEFRMGGETFEKFRQSSFGAVAPVDGR